ncbi:hypothetical protein [Acidisoma sp. 7E03]
MAQIVNPAALGIPGSDTSGNEIPWSLVLKANAFALDLLSSTQILGSASNLPGYCATLPFTPSGPDMTSTTVFMDAPTHTLYGPPGETPQSADMSSTAGFLDAASGHFYAPSGVVPEPANLSTTSVLADAPSGHAFSAITPEPAAVGTATVVVGADIGSFATPGSIPQ